MSSQLTYYTTRTTCRLCGSNSLTSLFSLGDQYVSSFVAEGAEDSQPLVPIELVLCEVCTLVQLRHTAPQELIYRRYYWYRSGVTATMRNALRDVTAAVENLVDLRPGDVVLDIGSNDGTLLRSYQSDRIVKVGVEPADNLVQAGSEGIDYFIHDFWSEKAYRKQVNRQAKVVTAIGMFYDLEDPNQFIADVAAVLDKDGVFIAQLMCLKNMINLKDVGNLAHEHLEFYSLLSLNYLFEKHGLEIFDIETNKVNGESYRLYVRLEGANVTPYGGAAKRVDAAEAEESEQGLDKREFYQEFFVGLEMNRIVTRRFIENAVSEGKRVWVYGASTKGNVLLQYYGLDHSLIEGASDRSSEKWGKYTVGTRIPIYSEEDARKANPDYFLVLPYAFLDEFVRREKEWRGKGGKFIVPLPKFRSV